MHPITPIRTSAAILTTTLFLLAPAAQAVLPESGIYWNKNRQGEAVVLEVQNGIASLIFYTYTADGEPEFYIAGGPIEEGVGYSEPVNWVEGYYPLHAVRSDLYRASNGPVISSPEWHSPLDPPPFDVLKVGRVMVTFAYHGRMHLQVSFDEPKPGQLSYGINNLERFNFGYAEFGTDRISAAQSCWTDLRGEWVFVDESEPARPAWRFAFTELTTSPDADEIGCPVGADELMILNYRDPIRGATLRCAQTRAVPDPIDDRSSKSGCELRLDEVDEPEFSFVASDIGLKRVVGSIGPLPRAEDRVLRSPRRVLGLRVE
jgi:hypothetical protein